MTKKYEIQKKLVLSNEHMTSKDYELLAEISQFPIGHEIHVEQKSLGFDDVLGFEIRIRPIDSPLHIHEIAAMKSFELSEALINLYKLAAELGCHCLTLDRDGGIYSNLPVFEW